MTSNAKAAGRFGKQDFRYVAAEAAVAVGVAPFCAKTSPKAATPRIVNAATIMTTKPI